jgi:ABC-2 type transport system ATP-binding protein/lipopolysaccharide transport system ATP-binding protein
MGEPAVHVDQVSKKFRLSSDRRTHLKELFVRGRNHYEEFWALRDVSLTVEPGTTFGLIGHNGSGKSTLLKLMAGIHRPTSGTITHSGRISALLELGAGFHPELSGRDNIYLNGAILGIKSGRIDTALERIVEFSGLGQFIDSPVKVYSSGMYARLGFSIAVHLDPEILIVDEILAVGDEDFQRRCFDYLEQLRSRGVTIIFVSHSLGIVQKLCDHVAWLDHGTLRQEGNALEVVEAYIESVNEIENARMEHVDDEAAPALVAVGETVSGVEGDAGGEGSEASDSAGEAISQGDPGGAPVAATPPARRGTGELRVTDVTFLSSGRRVNHAVSGEPLTIRLAYRTTRPIADPVFAIGIYAERGHKVANPHTTSQQIGPVDGAGTVDFELAALPLQQGHWRLSIGVTDPTYTKIFDHLDKTVLLKVQSSGRGIDLGGDVVLPGTWSHSAEESSS